MMKSSTIRFKRFMLILAVACSMMVFCRPGGTTTTRSFLRQQNRLQQQQQQVQVQQELNSHIAMSATPISTKTTTTTTTTTTPSMALTIGDLPGYTGFGRASSTTAPWYRVVYPRTMEAQVGIPYQFHIVCQHVACQDLSAVFYMRAYGPTLLTGTLQRIIKHDGISIHSTTTTTTTTYYEATLVFFEPGNYVLEVVLSFSHVFSIDKYPITTTEPLYEGYLLPHMPSILTVVGSSLFSYNNNNHTEPASWKACQSQDIYETSPTSALERGTWSLQSKVSSHGAFPIPTKDMDNNTFFQRYKEGTNSVGFRMRYRAVGCNLRPMQELVQDMLALDDVDRIHVVMMGDSNMAAQYKLLRSLLGRRVKSTIIRTNDGLHVRLPEIRHDLDQLLRSNKDKNNNSTKTKFYFLFNAGLHEIARLCSSRFTGSRRATISIPDDEEFSCIDEYRKSLEVVVQMAKDFPFDLRVFQSTTAGWLKWGNYGFSWPANRSQEYPLDSHACQQFNQVAWDVVNTHNGIPVVDAYWLTLSRPDHRQIDEDSKRGKKLVHHGVEVYNVLVRKWLSLILQMHVSQ